jgi:predicted AlkP superfamily phosphohydrolase/phosphomutase
VLKEWATPGNAARDLERLFGPSLPVDEVFGQHSVSEMLGLRRRLLGAAGRVADAATLLLDRQTYDLGWITFNAAHVAGHQFWDLSQLDEARLDDDARTVLSSTVDQVYASIDSALGRIVASLPPDSDLMVISPVGMEVNTSRADLLPEMLQAILDPRDEPQAGSSGPSGSIWRLRAMLPSGVRARVANALPARAALDLTARLEMRGVDWSTTRAFAHPAENQGYIRLNMRGRERDGIVDPADADALMDEIADGIRTFVDLDGSPAVASVDRVADAFGRATASTSCPI